MARERSPERDKAFQLWKDHEGKITNRAIAEQLNISEKTVGGWKSKDKWNGEPNGVRHKKERSTPKEKPEKVYEVEGDELTDKQRMFCTYYIKSFNATMSAIKAGYSADTAHVQGPRLLGNVRVREEISRIKSEMRQDIMIDANDLLSTYMKIAFADITDFTVFGKKEIQASNEFGPMVDDGGNPIMVEVNYVDFKDSTEVDGTIITEVQKGKNGPVIKLADKMKALDMLSKYFDLLSENDRKKLQDEKLRVDIAKGNAEVEKITDGDSNEPIEVVISRKVNR